MRRLTHHATFEIPIGHKLRQNTQFFIRKGAQHLNCGLGAFLKIEQKAAQRVHGSKKRTRSFL